MNLIHFRLSKAVHIDPHTAGKSFLLSKFGYRGPAAYSEDFVARISAPLLDSIHVTYYDSIIFPNHSHWQQLCSFIALSDIFDSLALTVTDPQLNPSCFPYSPVLCDCEEILAIAFQGTVTSYDYPSSRSTMSCSCHQGLAGYASSVLSPPCHCAPPQHKRWILFSLKVSRSCGLTNGLIADRLPHRGPRRCRTSTVGLILIQLSSPPIVACQ